jgi:RecA-family ATPase
LFKIEFTQLAKGLTVFTISAAPNKTEENGQSPTKASEYTAPLPHSMNHEGWTLARFKSTPPKLEFLVEGLIAQGITGCLYGPAGVGKSQFVLDLAIRIAIANQFPSKWVNTYPIEKGGNVVYLTGEEPEEELHRRIHGFCESMAGELKKERDSIFEECSKNLLVANFFGEPKQLFDISSNKLTPSEDYNAIHEALYKIKAAKGNIKLIVIDTRSAFSSAEGAGNALVSREASFYQKLASAFKAVVLLVHHCGKAGETYSAINSARGESALMSSMRVGFLLKELSYETRIGLGLSSSESKSLLEFHNSKQNYTAHANTIILERGEYCFGKTEHDFDLIQESIKGRQGEADCASVLGVVSEHPGINQGKVFEILKGRVSEKRCAAALKTLEEQGDIKVETGERNAKCYSLTEVEAKAD